MPGPQRDQIFVSYSHKDVEWLEKLQVHLKPVTRSGIIRVWADTEIRPGAKWKHEIAVALDLAKVAVLLVTPDFLASDFIAEEELRPLLEAAEKGGLIILWVPVKASLYTRSAVAEYQATIDPSQPLESLSSADVNKKLVEITKKIIEALAERPAAEPTRVRATVTDSVARLARPVPWTQVNGHKESLITRDLLRVAGFSFVGGIASGVFGWLPVLRDNVSNLLSESLLGDWFPGLIFGLAFTLAISDVRALDIAAFASASALIYMGVVGVSSLLLTSGVGADVAGLIAGFIGALTLMLVSAFLLDLNIRLIGMLKVSIIGSVMGGVFTFLVTIAAFQSNRSVSALFLNVLAHVVWQTSVSIALALSLGQRLPPVRHPACRWILAGIGALGSICTLLAWLIPVARHFR